MQRQRHVEVEREKERTFDEVMPSAPPEGIALLPHTRENTQITPAKPHKTRGVLNQVRTDERWMKEMIEVNGGEPRPRVVYA